MNYGEQKQGKQSETDSWSLQAKLILAGGRYERARLNKNYSGALSAEDYIKVLIARAEKRGIWAAPFLVRGRNVPRDHRDLQPLNV